MVKQRLQLGGRDLEPPYPPMELPSEMGPLVWWGLLLALVVVMAVVGGVWYVRYRQRGVCAADNAHEWEDLYDRLRQREQDDISGMNYDLKQMMWQLWRHKFMSFTAQERGEWVEQSKHSHRYRLSLDLHQHLLQGEEALYAQPTMTEGEPEQGSFDARQYHGRACELAQRLHRELERVHVMQMPPYIYEHNAVYTKPKPGGMGAHRGGAESVEGGPV